MDGTTYLRMPFSCPRSPVSRPITHPFPYADKIEYERLWVFRTLGPRFYSLWYSSFSAKQHVGHCTILGDELYPRPEMVEFILRPEPGVEKKVLDIGLSLL